MKRTLLTLMVIVAGLSAIAPDTYAQSSSRKQQRMDAWHRDMAEFRARSAHDREMAALADSIASVQARAALQNQDFVLEADNVTFKSGNTVFVNSTTNFISVKGNRAVVQISPSNFASGPNGVGGVTVDGMISGQKVTTDKKGRITYSMNVMGIGINAQVEIYMSPGTNRASATIYPNFNSNTIWVEGDIVPYENSNVFEGMSL
ncbi:MAG: DUF4251 domain-containing protein [Bacteroidales bacterium]|nr:DUF4251 domain-containing protein [Bacteroidales bacterium]MBQ8482942.1 DUF4251 domain-containing protein [Bacteroidales bacterium]